MKRFEKMFWFGTKYEIVPAESLLVTQSGPRFVTLSRSGHIFYICSQQKGS